MSRTDKKQVGIYTKMAFRVIAYVVSHASGDHFLFWNKLCDDLSALSSNIYSFLGPQKIKK